MRDPPPPFQIVNDLLLKFYQQSQASVFNGINKITNKLITRWKQLLNKDPIWINDPLF